LWLAGAASLCGQRTSFQQREEFSVEQRVVQLEERLAARSEDVKNLLGDVDALKGELKTVREQAKSAEDLSKSNQDRVDQISGIGRLILGAVAFLIGAIVTQFVSKLSHAPPGFLGGAFSALRPDTTPHQRGRTSLRFARGVRLADVTREA
jgi:hypothetical protein